MKISQNIDAPLDQEALGYALCALPVPTWVGEIFLIESPQCEAIRRQTLQTAHPSYFAVAMNEGKLPHLERIDKVFEWESFGGVAQPWPDHGGYHAGPPH